MKQEHEKRQRPKRKAKEEAGKKKAADELAAKSLKESSKKSKEAAKNAKKKQKRTVRGSVKEANYFAAAPSASQIDNVLHDIDVIVDKLNDLELETVATKLEGVTDAVTIKSVLSESAA